MAICGVASLIFFPIMSTSLCRKALSKVVITNGLVTANTIQGFLSASQHDAARIKSLQGELTQTVALLDKIKVRLPVAFCGCPAHRGE